MNQTTAPHSGAPAARAASVGARATGSSVDARAVAATAKKGPAARSASDFSDVVELSRRPPVPQLLLPIVGPPPSLPRTIPSPPHVLPLPPQEAARAPARPPGLAPALSASTPPGAFERSIASPPARESAAMDAFGFALAWVMTTAAGALVCGHVMARSQPPVVVHVPDVSRTTAEASEPPSSSSCPKSSWEPPLVAVGDLPAAPQSRAWAQRAVVSNDVATAAVARPSRAPQEPLVVRQSTAQTKAWPVPAARHARFAGPSAPSAGKAKASPRTLEEWMRASVDPG